MNIRHIQAAYLRSRMESGSVYIHVKGSSMQPTLTEGQKVCVADGKICLGSVVLIELQDGTLLVHRVILLLHKSVMTKGDNNLTHDQIYPIRSIIGTLVLPQSRMKCACFAIMSLGEAIINTVLYAVIGKRMEKLHARLIRIYERMIRRR